MKRPVDRRPSTIIDPFVDAAEKRIKRLPASFNDLLREGVLPDKKTGVSVRARLVRNSRIYVFATKPAETKRGRPQVVYAHVSRRPGEGHAHQPPRP